MTCAVVLAGEQDKHFFDKLTEITRSFFSPVTCWKGEISSTGNSSRLLICDYESFRHINLSPKIIIYSGKGWHEFSQADAEQTVVVVDSCNQSQISCVSCTKLPAITCGMHARDTITLSSMTGDAAVINQQRSIACFNGDTAEPQELPVRLGSTVDDYTLMAAASIFILTGNSDRLINASL